MAPQSATASTTLEARVSAARRRLVAAGIDEREVGFDAEVLARHALGWDRARYLSRTRDLVPPAFDERFAPLVERRCRREPVAHITGSREFWGLDIAVTRNVLIPRPESELLVETALALLVDRAATWDVADVGTGSGCLAVALAKDLRRARVTATDISPPALAVAQVNAERHGVTSRIEFHDMRGLDGLSGPYDLIVSNPPYVPEPDIARLAPEVAGYEPLSALCGGPDGLDPARELVPAVVARLRSGAWLVMEIGAGQSAAVAEIVAGQPELTLVEIRTDLQGHPRAAVIRRGGE
jgi:release factor glutamine methyltransferase